MSSRSLSRPRGDDWGLDAYGEHNARPRSDRGGTIDSTRDEVAMGNKARRRRLYVETRLQPHLTPRVSRSSSVDRWGSRPPLDSTGSEGRIIVPRGRGAGGDRHPTAVSTTNIADGRKRNGGSAPDASAAVAVSPPPSTRRRSLASTNDDDAGRTYRDESRDPDPSSGRFARSSSTGDARSSDYRHPTDDDDRFVSIIREEISKLESSGICSDTSTRGITKRGSVAKNSVESRSGPSTGVMRVVASSDDRLDDESTIDELRVQLRVMKREVAAGESEIADLKRRLIDVRREADEVVIEVEGRVESETSDLRRRLDDAQSALDEMTKAHASAIEEIRRVHERSLEGAARENDMLREELRQCRQRTEEVVRSMRDENENLKSMLDGAERDAESRRWDCVEMKSRYEDVMKEYGDVIDDLKGNIRLLIEDKTQLEKENIALKTELDDITHERNRYLHSLDDLNRLERENISLKTELDDVTHECNRCLHSLDDLDRLERENKSLKTELDDITHERNQYLHSLDDLNRLDRENTSLKTELDDITHERNRYLHSLDDLDRLERENTSLKIELNDMAQERNQVKASLDDTTNEATTLKSLTLSYDMEVMRLKEEIKVMQPRLALMNELTDSLEIALAEKDEVTLSFERLLNDLRSALLEKEDVVDKCNKLEIKYTRLQAARNSESHVAEMLRKERDGLSGMVEMYLNEIGNLRRATTEISRERDELKDELICVLETAASALD